MSTKEEPDWVATIEAWRIIGRHRTGTKTDAFLEEEARTAAGILAAGGREGRFKSEGWRSEGVARERLTTEDWQTRRLDIARSRLLEMRPWTRRIPHPDRITDVFVDANDIRRMLMPEQRRRGSLPKFDWDAAECAVDLEVKRRGIPEPSNDIGWRGTNDVKRFLEKFFEDRNTDGVSGVPSESVLKDYAGRFIAKLRRPKTG